ncbi:leupaxin-like [Oscarella lobularis]|uniref:leupaxin-like n=1 Tax=Oscarella lobularis TaxID=121494 RepID=UPI00331395AB
MDDLEALLHDLQSAAPLRDSEPKADPRKRADVSSLSYQEWPEPPPPVEPQNAPPPSNGDDFPAPPEPFGADNADNSSLPPPVVPPLPQAYQETAPAPKPGPTSTSANLAELDSLLETLTDTYTSELDKAASDLASESAVGTARGGSDGPDAPVSAPVGSTSPESRRTNVKALLSELDSVIDSKESPVSAAGAGVKETQNSASSKIDTSTAAKELDDLMESLSVFKVNAGKKASVTSHPPSVPPPQLKESGGGGGGDGGQSTTAPYAVPHRGRGAPAAAVKPNPAQIDSMLGQLQSNVSEQGIDTTAKGVCPACKKEIVGQLVTALGATWHPEHFTCASCNAELCRQTFYEREGRAYCEKDYHNLFSPRCAYCNGPVLESCITAMGKTWHPEHFFCHHCSRPFGADVFHERDGQAYCEKDFYALFAPKCGACAKPIMSGFVSAINQQWHGECFVCWACKQPFAGGNFFEFERKPYCEFHYHERRGSLCYGCQKPILGRCITAMQRKFHPEHFVCAFCLKQLNQGTFKENNEKPYCHACHIKLFG